jgi:DNA invertase Pin-like site-specific DNA recombinase
LQTKGAPPLLPAVLYAAKSTEDRHGSIPDQLARTRGLAESEGREIAGEFCDEGFSAYTGNRGPGLEHAKARAIELARNHGGCLLVALHSDRIARGAGDAPGAAEHLVEVVAFLRRHGVKLRTVEDDLFADERIGLLMAAVQGQRNTEDSRRKSESVAAGMRRRAVERGGHNGPAPLGYRYAADRSGLEVVAEEAEVVRCIFRDYVAGQSMTRIARDLREAGVRTKRGAVWRQAQISKIVRNPVYVGKVGHKGELFDGTHEPILEAWLWERAAQLVAAAPSRPGCPPRGRRHLFSGGLLRCGRCGAAMLCRSGRQGAYEYYQCAGRPEGCEAGSARRDPVDETVLAYFARVGVDIDATRDELLAAKERRLAEIEALLAGAEEEVEGARARLARVKGDYLGAEITAAEWRELRSELEPEVEAAESQAERLREQLEAVRLRAALSAAEDDALGQLARLRAAVAGEVRSGQDLDAVRATLRRLFVHFLFHPEEPAQGRAHLLVGGHYWIEPQLREETLAEYGDWLSSLLQAERPQPDEEDEDQSPYRHLFGPIVAESRPI